MEENKRLRDDEKIFILAGVANLGSIEGYIECNKVICAAEDEEKTENEAQNGMD